MPLLDHFHPPLSRTHPWRTFHGTWAVAMARLLNAGVLPSGYYAAAFLSRDGPVEIDVATLHKLDPSSTNGSTGGTLWSPGEPQLAVAVEWPSLDEVHVEVYSDEGDPRLAATIELVSPSNKDRPKTREAFAAKCVEHLCRGCGVVVVDVVTTRHANIQAELFATLGAEPPTGLPTGLSAVSYQSVGREADGQLHAWPAALELGRPLPTVPLWLAGETSVPLDLEASHSTACVDLRIRQAG